MSPAELVPYDGQIVELRFFDGEQIRAHVISVDPHVLKNHLFYVLLEVRQSGPPPRREVRIGDGCACSAQDIAELIPTDGKRHAPSTRAPWWRFW